MLNKIILSTNSQGRLNIPNDLLEIVEISPGDKVAFSSCEDSDKVRIVSLKRAYNCKIIAVMKSDQKGRIVLPAILFPEKREELYFEVYVFNGELFIKEIDI